ncbi:MAG: hypothetical protein J2O49_08285, partial [Sciscionella sp.]|nr:hypothetical protein [Sciscionella sp.]
LATFATLVTAKAGEDEAAQRILASAVRILTDLAVDARPAVNASPAVNTNPAVNANPAVDASPIVLIGGLIGQGGPLSERVRAALATRTGAPVLTAGDGAAGAAWLAAVEVLGDGAAHPNAGTSTR